MKNFILNRGYINRITDTAPAPNLAPGETAVEVSDDVASQVATLRAAKQAPMWLDGALTSREAQREAGILQPASALTAIRLCMGLIPAVLVVLALLVMRRWPRQPSSALPAT
jgi:Na+/melibiose symporter-like transporter